MTQFEVKEEAKTAMPPLVPLDMQKVRTRHERACKEKQIEFDAVSKGVSYEGLQLFRFIKKT